MKLKARDLKPYKSVTLAHIADSSPKAVVNAVLDDLKHLLGLDAELDRLLAEQRSRKLTVQRMALVNVEDEATGRSHRVWRPDGTDVIRVGFFHYLERRAPGWYAGEGIEDQLNHLAVVVQRQRHMALYLSDNRRHDAVRRHLGNSDASGFSRLQPLSRDLLNGAFVQGPTRTLWLSGIQVPVSVKADTKTLSGLNLRDALDPLGDQTYHFTAARSSVPELNLPVGVSPPSSRVWVGPTRNWEDFCSTLAAVLGHLDAGPVPVARPLPVLASPVAADEMPALSEAFELHFVPPELLADDPAIGPEERELMERWAYRSDFEIVGSGEDWFDTQVHLEGREVGVLHLALDVSNPERVRISEHRVTAAAGIGEDVITELENVSGQLRWFKVWFETGHALADGTVFAIRHRDEPFFGFRWINLVGYRPDVEKFWSGAFPKDAVDRIGKEKSLFCWVRNEWTNPGDSLTTAGGWLACDDGAMEIADFIHLDDRSDPPVLSLIHVKGAKSDSPDRQISVSSYEVVVGQAVKNLRYLDRLYLEEGLAEGLGNKISELVWHDRKPVNRQDMVEALRKIGTSYRRLVVVLQPHAMRSRVQKVRQTADHPDKGRLQQLDTLLHGASASCHSLGADLIVLGDDR